MEGSMAEGRRPPGLPPLDIGLPPPGCISVLRGPGLGSGSGSPFELRILIMDMVEDVKLLELQLTYTSSGSVRGR